MNEGHIKLIDLTEENAGAVRTVYLSHMLYVYR